MIEICLTIADLDKLKPCPDDGPRVRDLLRKFNADEAHCFTAAEAREAGCSFGDIAWVSFRMGRSDPTIDRRIRLFLNDCAIRVLPVFEAQFPDDPRPRLAIEATAQWAAGKIDVRMRIDAAAEAAWAARAAGAADAAWAAEAAWAAWAAGAADAAWAAEREWQFDRLIAWLSPDEPEPLPLPYSIKETVK